MTPLLTLEKYWGYASFRHQQEKVIESVLLKKDTLAIMPTGGGKSVCFQVPAMMLPGICLVITPLIALMKDQVANLKQKGIFALSIHSGMKYADVKRTLENAVHGNYKFLYVSPERLETELFLGYLSSIHISLIAVDEAHCISQWGYDFRPSYLRIATLRDQLKGVPVLALTASATPAVQTDIAEKLNFSKGYNLFLQSYERANLSYSVFSPPSKENKLLEVLSKVNGSGIVYCRSRRGTKLVAQLLSLNGISADYYHAGLTTEDRATRQENWIQNKTRIICCTNAFGMGIDKPDVRTVVHFEIPEALEFYYQEAGRAGRDGKKSYAVLLFHKQEITDLQERISLRFPDMKKIRAIYGLICDYIQLPAGKGKGMAFDFEISAFLERNKMDAVLLFSVLKILEQEEVWSFNEQFFSPSTVEILASRNTLEDVETSFPQFSTLLKGLLRSYEGILDQPVLIDEFSLAKFIAAPKDVVIKNLNELHRLKIIDYTARKESAQIFFSDNRVPADSLFINLKNLSDRKTAYETRLNAMIEYTTLSSQCRSSYINQYFTKEAGLPCGICDVCLRKKQKGISLADFELTKTLLQSKGSITLAEMQQATSLNKEKLLQILQFMKEEGTISLSESGEIKSKNN